MAQSRLEKIGTVYTRITALFKTKALKEENMPVWVKVYETFPPKYEPRYDRRMPKKYVKPIFYEEDLIRARFHKDQDFIPITNLANENIKSATQHFLSIYKTVKQDEGLSDDSAYEHAMKRYMSETRMQSKKENQ